MAEVKLRILSKTWLGTLAIQISASSALAGETHTAVRWDLGLVGGLLDFLGSQPFVLLFLTLALGTRLGRQPLGFIKLGSTAGTLLVGILISLAAHLGYGITYDVPALLTTVFLNLFMFAVGLKVGPQFFAGLRRDGLKFVTISLLVVGLNFVAVFILAKVMGLAPGFATGIIAGSMTDTAVIGAAAGAVQSGSYRPPAGITAEGVMGNVAAGYAIIYLFSLVGIILLIRYLPRLFSVDVMAAARAAEESYGGGENRLPFSGTEAAYKLPTLKVDARAYRVENPSCFGLPLFEFSEKYEVPVLQLLRGDQVIDFDANPILQEGDIITVVTEAARLIQHGTQVVGPEVADERARRLDLEVADLVVTRKEFSGLPMKEAAERMRRAMFPKASEVARIFHPLGVIRAGESIPVWSKTKLERGDIARVLGPKTRIDQAGRIVGAVVRYSTASDVLSMAIGLGLGYIFGYLSIQIGAVPVSLGTPAGVMLAGIAMSTLRSRYPLFGGPVSEGARSLLQDLGLDLFIAVIAVNTAPNVAAAFTGGGVLGILIIGILSALIPPLIAWLIGWKVLKLNTAVLLGAISGARFSTPAMQAAQEACGGAIPAVGYPVPYAVAAVLVLVAGFMALFL
jgi:putative transport protein